MEIEANKYSAIVDSLKIKDVGIKEKLLSVFDYTVGFINDNFSGRTKNEKISTVYVTKEIILEEGGLYDEDKLEKIVNGFFKYYDDNYQNYLDGFELITDEFHSDLSFCKKFIKQHLEPN